MIENQNAEQIEEEQVAIEVTEDPVEGASPVDDGDELEVDLPRSTVKNLANGTELTTGKFPDVMLRILEEGGLIPYIKKYGDFRL